MENEITSLTNLLKKQLNKANEPCRLLHGRGGCFEGFSFLNIDFFDSVLIVMLHESRPMDWMEELSRNILSDQIKGVVIQDRSVSPSSHLYFGEIPDRMTIKGEGLIYELSPKLVKNPGWFIDMREGRAWMAQHAKGNRVLNLFSYTCSFSVMALKHGAEHVLNMDMNKSVLNRGRKNHELNNIDMRKVSFMQHHVLKSFGKIKRFSPYDIVVIDPPSIQTGHFQLRRDYPKLMRRLPDWLSNNGKALLCCNDPMVSDKLFTEWIKKELDLPYNLKRLPQAEDIPEKQLDRALKLFEVSLC